MLKWFLKNVLGLARVPGECDLELDVYSEKFIPITFVENLLVEHKDLRVHRSKDEADTFYVQKVGSGGRLQPGIVIREPFEVLREFLPKQIVNTMDAPCWQISISTMEECPGSMKSVMETIYQALANEGSGLVCHSRTLDIIYQGTNMRRALAEKCGLEVNEMPQLQIEWFVPDSKQPREFLAELVALWKEIDPRFLPVLYGHGSIRNRFRDEDLEQFFRKLAEKPNQLLFWQSMLPVVGGHISQAEDDSKWKILPPRYARYHKIQCSILTAALDAEPDLPAKIDALFQRTSLLLDAFFASAIVMRYEPSRPWQVPQHFRDNYSLQYGPWWQGLPCLPVWMAWYGRAYYPYVSQALLGVPGASTVGDDHLLLKVSEQPLNLDDLRGIFPEVPAELVVRESQRDVPAGAIASRSYESADFIPPIISAKAR